MQTWLVNGQSARTLALDDRGLNYGDGLFETVAVRSGRLRLFERHLERLKRGLERLNYPQLDLAGLADEARLLARGQDRAVLKIVVTRGAGPRGYKPPEPGSPTRILGLSPAARANDEAYRAGVQAQFCATPLSQNALLAGLKTLGRLDNVMASSELAATDAQEGLMCLADDRLVCGTMSNVFLVSGHTLVTPSLAEAGVAGIMRELILQQASQCELDVQVRDIERDSVTKFDEVFLSNSQFGIWPIKRIGKHRFESRIVTDLLMSALADCGIEECAWR